MPYIRKLNFLLNGLIICDEVCSMKRRLYNFSFLMLLLFIFTLSVFSGCTNKFNIYGDEFFLYIIGSENNEIGIVGLTEKGREQEILIVPEKINGKRVRTFGSGVSSIKTDIEKKYGKNSAGFQTERLQKLYIRAEIKLNYLDFDYIFDNAKSLNACILIPNAGVWGLRVPEIKLGANQTVSIYGTKNAKRYNQKIANVSYYYNYEGAKNGGYYWLDNYDYGSKIEYIPQDPTREGYNFGGWYKEPECLTKWDFESDALPTIKTDGEGNAIYQETKLFAKWINI